MSGDRMNGDDPLQALADMLDVEPSPGFAARVRQHIDADRGARRRMWRYAIAAAVPLLAALIIWVANPPPQGRPPATSSRVAETRALTADGPMPGTDAVSAARPTAASSGRATGPMGARGERGRREARVARNRPRTFATAPVVVPPGQLEGVRQLARAAATGRVRMGPPLADWAANVDPEVAPLAAPDPLRVPLIDVEPLTN
jgi:hypothetical protein